MNKAEIIEILEEHKKILWTHYMDMATREEFSNYALEFNNRYYECRLIIKFLREHLND